MNDAQGSPQTVLVFGGTSEIAQSLLRRLAARRAHTVVLAGRDPVALEAVATQLRVVGVTTVDTMAFEATDTGSHGRLVDDAFDRLGDVDLTLVAFGALGDQAALELDPAAAARLAAVNYVAAVSVGLAVAARLRAQGHGNLVALSSVAAERPRRSNFVYGSSKAGMDAFFRGLADALRGSGARVMVVRPGFVHTRMTAGMTPQPFATTPDAVAEAIVRGLETGAETVWAPPVLRWVMTVLRHLPAPIFRRLDQR
ncbi:MAG TPA: decaprenylphospho-beta-D-erythro-pentofuranosid-2-ulose 2-reductase [Acidimicrobiales bacterium]|jgi:decaprenylphospho-beta-D-erythro-pentofuranosid-2-ulose 2-reductase|nr:decaprenylphospho-beta-D-erythro-pentofuranosid-2-ulose 2-reductase [Acidimicrobiales bacterium]